MAGTLGDKAAAQPTLALLGSGATSHGLAPRRASLMLCAAGIVGLLVAYGYLQEKIMTTPYAGSYFADAAVLVLLNRLVGAAVAAVALLSTDGSLRPAAPWRTYVLVSVANVGATLAQYESLRYVSFPTQTLGKCAKMLPTLALGTCVLGRPAPARDYAVASLVTAGATLFLLAGPIGARVPRGSGDDTPLGLALLAAYLLLDGLTTTVQERAFRGCEDMSIYDQMLHVNVASAGLSIAMLALAPGAALAAPLAQLASSPDLAIDALLLSATAVAAQVLIYWTIKAHGAYTMSTIMTTRQFVSICVSSMLFMHPLTPGQWLGGGIVTGALYARALLEARARSSRPALLPVASDIGSNERIDAGKL